MRFPTVQITLLLAGIASADWTKQLTEGDGSRLLKRASCRGQSCATCFGPGNIICAGNSCFNPSAGEQCCSDGSYCIGATTACCGSLGAGQVSSDSLPGTSTPVIPSTTRPPSISSATVSAPGANPSTSIRCGASDSGEQCCQRFGSAFHWCSGTTHFICFAASLGEVCCDNGQTCDSGPDCCAALGAAATTPTPSAGFTSFRSTSSRSIVVQTSSFSGLNTTPTSRSSAAAATTIGSVSGNAAATGAIGDFAAAAVGLVGLVLL